MLPFGYNLLYLLLGSAHQFCGCISYHWWKFGTTIFTSAWYWTLAGCHMPTTTSDYLQQHPKKNVHNESLCFLLRHQTPWTAGPDLSLLPGTMSSQYMPSTANLKIFNLVSGAPELFRYSWWQSGLQLAIGAYLCFWHIVQCQRWWSGYCVFMSRFQAEWVTADECDWGHTAWLQKWFCLLGVCSRVYVYVYSVHNLSTRLGISSAFSSLWTPCPTWSNTKLLPPWWLQYKIQRLPMVGSSLCMNQSFLTYM